MKLEVTPIRFKDVRGKELFYIRIENKSGKEVLINVGTATLEGVEKLIKQDERLDPMGIINEKPTTGTPLKTP